MTDDEDGRRAAIRDSRPSYAADSVLAMLRMAANKNVAKRDLLESIYLSRRVPPVRDTITTEDIAEAVGRDDAERRSLAEAFRTVDRDRDIWLQCGDIWLRQIGAMP